MAKFAYQGIADTAFALNESLNVDYRYFQTEKFNEAMQCNKPFYQLGFKLFLFSTTSLVSLC